jgi:uncharacterized protein (TIGR00725 family)
MNEITKAEIEVCYVIGVMGARDDPHHNYTKPLGPWIAEQGCHLLTGGMGGVMAAVSEEFCAANYRNGKCIGVIPTDGHANKWVEVAVASPYARFNENKSEGVSANHSNIHYSDVVIALPGGNGTKDEVGLAVEQGTPVIVYAPEDMWASYPAGAPKTDDISVVQQFVADSLLTSQPLAATRINEVLAR